MPGAAPKRHVVREGRARQDWRALPREGYQGPVPHWPGPKHEGQEKVWEQVWRCPQAVVWIDGGSTLHRTIARYATLIWRTENEKRYPVVILQEIRQLEDRLGLSPLAMRRNFMEMETVDQQKRRLEMEAQELLGTDDDDGNVTHVNFG
jgi:hypothetical protein